MKIRVNGVSIKKPSNIAVILIVLIVGSGVGYYVGQKPLSGMKEEVNILAQNINDLNTQLDELEDNLQDIQSELSSKQNELNTLNTEYNNLQNTYSKLQNDYDTLKNLIPYSPIDSYTENKNKTEGTSKVDLVGTCGENYIIPAPVNAENWEINITIISELPTQAVHITLYQLVGDYPPDYSAQPIAPNVSGTGSATISATLDTSYAYVVKIRDAYAKPFTGTIEEKWYPTLPPSTEIPGIINGDFSLGREGWYTQGKSSGAQEIMRLYQRYGGTYTTQNIVIGENQGLSFRVKPGGARFEIQIDGHIIYYGDLGDDQEWRVITVPFGNTYIGPRDLYFIVLSGKDDGSYIALDDIKLVQFEES